MVLSQNQILLYCFSFIKQLLYLQPNDRKNPLEVKDINEYWVFKSKRETNPLNPTYEVPAEEGGKVEIGKIDRNQPKELHPKAINKETGLNLNTQDIAGA